MVEEIVSPLLHTEWGRRIGFISLMVASAGLLLSLITTSLTWRQDYQLSHQKIVSSASTATVSDTAKWIKHIPDAHLLGMAPSAGSIPLTSLQLRLVGVVKSEASQASHVIISEAGQPGKVYQVGDALIGRVKVSEIVSDGVIVDNGGHLEKLPLERLPLEFQPRQTSLLGE